MTPTQIEQALSDWTSVARLRELLGTPLKVQLVPILKEGIDAGRLEERWAVPDWSYDKDGRTYLKSATQWQVRRRDANT